MQVERVETESKPLHTCMLSLSFILSFYLTFVRKTCREPDDYMKI